MESPDFVPMSPIGGGSMRQRPRNPLGPRSRMREAATQSASTPLSLPAMPSMLPPPPPLSLPPPSNPLPHRLPPSPSPSAHRAFPAPQSTPTPPTPVFSLPQPPSSASRGPEQDSKRDSEPSRGHSRQGTTSVPPAYTPSEAALSPPHTPNTAHFQPSSDPHRASTSTDGSLLPGPAAPHTPSSSPRYSPTPLPSAPPTPAPTTPTSSRPPPSRAAKPVTLPTPPPITFQPPALPVKHLTLDAAQWTLTSAELQGMVSLAIRESAKEKCIQLLAPTTEASIREDEARLEREWAGTVGRWRFEAGRRNMLLKGLSALAPTVDDPEAVQALLAQLNATLIKLDASTEALLHVAGQRAQLQAARDMHRASALAVALRKLNASYARRTRELEKERNKRHIAEGEVEEAWKVAEEVAAEVDKLRALEAARILEAEAAAAAAANGETSNALPSTLVTSAEEEDADLASSESEQWLGGHALAVDGDMTHMSRISRVSEFSQAEVVPVVGTAVRTPARAFFAPAATLAYLGDGASEDGASARDSDAGSVATREKDRSKRLSTASQVSKVSAARKRSMRASKASLRMPQAPRSRASSAVRGRPTSDSFEAAPTNGKARSRSRRGRDRDRDRQSEERPPLPPLALGGGEAEGSFLEMEARSPSGEREREDYGEKADEGEEEEKEEGNKEKEKEKAEEEDSPVLAYRYSSPYPPQSTAPSPTGPEPPKPPAKRPRSPTSPNLLASYAPPPASASASGSESVPASASSSTAALSRGLSSPSLSPPLPRPPPLTAPHDVAFGPDPDATVVRRTKGKARASDPTLGRPATAPALGRRGYSLELPPDRDDGRDGLDPDDPRAGKPRGNPLRRSMSELLRIGLGKGARGRRRGSVQVAGSMAPAPGLVLGFGRKSGESGRRSGEVGRRSGESAKEGVKPDADIEETDEGAKA